MDIVTTAIYDWFKSILSESIISFLEIMFDMLDPIVTSAASDIGQTPAQWNSNVFSLVETLSETVILPIGGMILTAVACYELIQMIIARNNSHDIDTFMFFKWALKTCAAILILTNSFNIVMGIFDVAQYVIDSAANVINTSGSLGSIGTSGYYDDLMDMNLGELIVVSMQVNLMFMMSWLMSFIIYIIIFGRMLEIYLMVSLAPIPLATLTADNHQINIGANYLKSLFAIGFQGFLMLVCIGIYIALLQTVASLSNPLNVGWSCVVFSGFLCYGLFQTGRLTKTIFGAH